MRENRRRCIAVPPIFAIDKSCFLQLIDGIIAIFEVYDEENKSSKNTT